MGSKKEDSIQAALSDYHSGKFTSLRATARAHNVPLTTLFDRNAGRATRQISHQIHQRLTPGEEDFLVQWIIEQDHQGFPPTHIRAKEMAERILHIHGDTKPLGKKLDYLFQTTPS
jgi:iron-sulfur cluster repair protein YtfE (RIC family)